MTENIYWNVPDYPMPEVDVHALRFAEDVNSTFVNKLSDTQLKTVLGAYEAGKSKSLRFWNPIHTAPKNVIPKLLWDENEGVYIGHFFPRADNAVLPGWWVRNSMPVYPTHWMPLPLSPEKTE